VAGRGGGAGPPPPPPPRTCDDRDVRVRPLTPDDAQAIAEWRYPGRDSTYDVGEIMTPERGVWAVVEVDELIGFACFGAEARVPGVEEEPGVLDVGYGMRPDLVGQGLGRTFVTAILDFAAATFDAERFRLLILDWNERSRRVAVALEFHEERLVPSNESSFRVLSRPVHRT
jgi:ribosomal-protein-alanine N-acetyltransferase